MRPINIAPVPADRGPAGLPKIACAAMAARSTSVSNHSPVRSATDIGIQRASRFRSCRPIDRAWRPTARRRHQSRPVMASIDGGAWSFKRPITPRRAASIA
jgi:hypothetical protein